MKIAVVGLGKLGLPLAALYANASHEVFGIDLNQTLVDKVNSGVSPYPEAELAELLADDSLRRRLTASTSYDAVKSCRMSVVIVPTPSVEGVFSNEYVLSAVRSIGAALPTVGEHTVVICSTMMPGSLEGAVTEALAESSGRDDIGLAYSPEFIALGSVVNDLKHPDFLLIGATDDTTGDLVEQTLRGIARDVGVYAARMTPTEAEIAKLAVNTYITMKISFANQIGELCSSVGVDVDAVLDAVGADRRIGRAYLKAGMPFGGPCFPRDTVAFRQFCIQQRVPPFLGRAVDLVNQRRKDFLANLTESLPGPYAIFGVAYKPGTDVLEESIGIYLTKILIDRGAEVLVVDPTANLQVVDLLGDKVTLVSSSEEALLRAKTVIIGNLAAPARERISDRSFAAGLQVLDIWRA